MSNKVTITIQDALDENGVVKGVKVDLAAEPADLFTKDYTEDEQVPSVVILTDAVMRFISHTFNPNEKSEEEACEEGTCCGGGCHSEEEANKEEQV
jgi:hypothetical protein